MTPPQPSSQTLREIEDKFFVAGQMDAQGHEAEKWRVGSGGPVLAMSRRLLAEARALAASLSVQIPPDTQPALLYALALMRNRLDVEGPSNVVIVQGYIDSVVSLAAQEASPQPDLAREWFEKGWAWAEGSDHETAADAYLAACRQEQP